MADNDTSHTPEELLKMLRGQGMVCGCGKTLIPAFDDRGNRIGVTHETPEDDDFHMAFFMGVGKE